MCIITSWTSQLQEGSEEGDGHEDAVVHFSINQQGGANWDGLSWMGFQKNGRWEQNVRWNNSDQEGSEQNSRHDEGEAAAKGSQEHH